MGLDGSSGRARGYCESIKAVARARGVLQECEGDYKLAGDRNSRARGLLQERKGYYCNVRVTVRVQGLLQEHEGCGELAGDRNAEREGGTESGTL